MPPPQDEEDVGEQRQGDDGRIRVGCDRAIEKRRETHRIEEHVIGFTDLTEHFEMGAHVPQRE